MGDKDDGLRLSLSLGFGEENHHKNTSPSPTFPLNLIPSSLPNFMQQQQQQQQQHQDQLQKTSLLADVFQSASERNGAEPRSSLRGIDVNRPATAMSCDEEVIVSSPNSTVSSVSGKRSEREENEAERASSSMEDDGGDGAARKKLRLSKEQAAVLEDTFKDHNTLNPKQKLALAKHLDLKPRQVEVWFQNRRARTKLKQTEVDYEYLKRCCENLTEENRRLQKEVNELRALKLSPQFYMNPPTTLTMCPQCERVAVSSSPATATAAASSSLSPTSMGITRQPNPLRATNQLSIPLSPWAAIFPNQSLDIRQAGLDHNLTSNSKVSRITTCSQKKMQPQLQENGTNYK